MTTTEGTGPRDRPLEPALAPLLGGLVLALLLWDVRVAAAAGLAAIAVLAWRARMRWLAAGAALWFVVFVAILTVKGPYSSWAGPSVLPVLAGYVGCFLLGWALARRYPGRRRPVAGDRPPALVWPSDRRLRWYLLALLAIGVFTAVLRYHSQAPPLFAANPDAARQVLREQSNIVTGLLAEAWTLGLATSLLRALVGSRSGRWTYLLFAAAFLLGAALGASKNSVLVGIAPALVAALSVRRAEVWLFMRTKMIVLIGIVAVGGTMVLGAERTLAGTGAFETEFRAQYGSSVLVAGVASLDLALTSSTETFGRLWAQRESFPPRYGSYTLTFMGSHEHLLVPPANLYATTSALSLPYHMNTATFAAIPLLDYGPAGAAIFLLLLGALVGFGDRRLEFSTGPAQHIGRGLIIYFALFGIYELYPAIYPTWLSLVPGLVCLYLLGRRRTRESGNGTDPGGAHRAVPVRGDAR